MHKFHRSLLLTVFGIASLCSVNAAAASARPAYDAMHPPLFTQFPVDTRNASVHAKPTVKPVLNSKKARTFRTMIRNGFEEEANFAGHYRVIIWGCGTDCRDFAIADKNTGAVYVMPGVTGISGMLSNDDERLDFKPDSRLFIIAGSIDEKPLPSKSYYLWTGSSLRLLFSVPLQTTPDEPGGETK